MSMIGRGISKLSVYEVSENFYDLDVIMTCCFILFIVKEATMRLLKVQTPTVSRKELKERLHKKLMMMALRRGGLKRLKIKENLFMIGRTRTLRNRLKRQTLREQTIRFIKSREIKEGQRDEQWLDEDESGRMYYGETNDTVSFNDKVVRFLSETDVLSLHKCSTLLFEPRERKKLDWIQHEVASVKDTLEEWTNSAHFFSECAGPLHQTTSINAGNIFIVQGDAPELPIVLDTGASKSLTPNRSDFVTFKKISSTVSGIGARSQVEGIGKVRWKIYDQNGTERQIETLALYMPTAKIRLYSPQTHFKEHKSGEVQISWNEVVLKLPNDVGRLSFPFNPVCNLPLMLIKEEVSTLNYVGLSSPIGATCWLSEFVKDESVRTLSSILPPETRSNELMCSVMDEQNSNLSSAQRELLAWHFRWGHVSMSTIQRLIRPKNHPGRDNGVEQEHLTHPVIIRSNFNSHACDRPHCAACHLGKATRTKIATKSNPGSSNGALKRGHLDPGDCVSMDQYEVFHHGRTLNSSKGTVVGGTIFVDHASGRMMVKHQESLNAAETLVGKRRLDREAKELGFRVKKFVADNGIFRCQEFLQDLVNRNQSIHFSGVGGKHQNGVAENAIGTVSTLTRTMLIHASLRWPATHDLKLWPLCFSHAVYIYNKIPGDDGLSPNEKWFGVKDTHDHLRKLHPWGCPGYVLEARLQDGHKIPKFSPRSRQGIFLGYSEVHASSVALMLNRKTGHISPQYHVVFDDFFTTVRGIDDDKDPDLNAIDWEKFINVHGSELYTDPDESEPDEVNLDDSWNRVRRGSERLTIDNGGEQRENQTAVRTPERRFEDALETSKSNERRTSIEPTERKSVQNVPTTDEISEEDREFDSEDDRVSSERVSRPRRTRVNNRRYFGDEFVNKASESLTSEVPNYRTYQCATKQLELKHTGKDQDQAFLQSLDWGDSFDDLTKLANSSYAQQLFREVATTADASLDIPAEVNSLIFSAKANDADTPRWHQAVHGEHSKGFWTAMKCEIDTLTALGAWSIVPMESWMKVLPSTWAFRIKRFPSGLVKKLKARICVMGNRQDDVDPFECYAPVVAWTTVRLMLILSIILEWKSVQVDYTSAFCQAKIKEEIFVTQPRGWQQLNRMGLKEPFKEGHVMKLERCLYGLKQSPKNWYLHLKERLESVGFKQSQCDPCLFYQKNIICLCYVDDCIFFSTEENKLMQIVNDIKDAELDLNVEDDVAGFLGVLLTRNEDGTISLTQTGLIDRILEALGLQDCNSTRTPAQRAPLPLDKDGEALSEPYNYASVVGMLMYLTGNTRPDITFAVHQCARHCHNPKQIHGKYLKQIGRYLRGTKDKGIILRPMRNEFLHLEGFADADFAGLWGAEDSQDPHCVKSRSGSLILVNGCPVMWGSKLQTEIATSTMQAEYIALSSACRDIIPLKRLIEEVTNHCGLRTSASPVLKTTIYEDNEGALKLANTELPRITPKSKHFAVKYHWFRQHVMSGELTVVGIRTTEQLADIFTKGLPWETFNSLRNKLMGW